MYNFQTKNGVIFPVRNQIIKDFHKGLSNKELSEKYQINHITISSFLRKQKLFYRPQIKNPNYFEKIDTPNKAYFLGFIAADGCIVHDENTKTLTITIHSKDRIILEKLREEIQAEHAIKNINTKMSFDKSRNVNHVRFSISIFDFIKHILDKGIEPRKSLTMPNIILNIPKEFRDSFIIGYLDGDGCITSRKTIVLPSNSRTISFKGSKDFLEGIVQHLELTKYSLKQNKGQNIHTLYFCNQPDIRKILRCYQNSDFYLQRKYEKLISSEFYQDRTISSS